MQNCTVVFKPTNKTIEVSKGTSLMEAARSAGVFLDAPCAGKGHCGKCKVKILSGVHEFEKTSLLSDEELKKGIRLACLTKIEGDLTVEVIALDAVNDIMVEDITSDSSKAGRAQQAIEVLKTSGLKIQKVFSLLPLKLSAPSIDDNISDGERIIRDIKRVIGTDDIKIPYSIYKNLPGTIRKSDYDLTFTLRKHEDNYELLKVDNCNNTNMYGLCVDIGTTTVAACLVDLSTDKIKSSANSGNLQMQYGGDVISRIIYSTKPEGLEKLNECIVNGTINQLIERMLRELNITKDDIICSVFAGNTTMTHFFLGVDAQNIRLEPYIPAFRNAPEIRAKEIGLKINPEAPVFLLPNVASYVGGDIVSGVLAAGFWNDKPNTLFLDLGTNGEIVFGNEEWMLTCACSAGPAFEGGEISCGMRASIGAIDQVKIDKRTFEPKINVIANTKPKGICGSGIIDLIAEMFVSGIIDGKGKIIKHSKTKRIRLNPNMDCYEYVLVWGKHTADGRDITINEIDIDNFLRAKGAVYSAVRTLLKSVCMDAGDIDRVIIAGGIGQNLDIKNSIIIGMLPDIDPAKFEFIGNSSLAGAYACLISDEARAKAREIAESMTYIELSADPHYMEEFVGACFLPHTDINLFPSTKKAANI